MRQKRVKLLRSICGFDPHGDRKYVKMTKTGQVINTTKTEYSKMKKEVHAK